MHKIMESLFDLNTLDTNNHYSTVRTCSKIFKFTRVWGMVPSIKQLLINTHAYQCDVQDQVAGMS